MTDWTVSTNAANNPTDLYAQLLQIKTGGRGCLSISKKHAKASGITWSFVEQSCSILNLKLVRDGQWGYVASKA